MAPLFELDHFMRAGNSTSLVDAAGVSSGGANHPETTSKEVGLERGDQFPHS
jgi:hypothetical protein